MRYAVRVVFLLAIGVLPALADQLPASCGAVGANSYTPPPVTIPSVVLNSGTVITVTNATMAINGDTSSVQALMANPGPDGISLPEAINATNNQPGTWNIRFAPALKGSTIVVDSQTSGPQGLSYLTGGNVTINGDLDGDGKPDITLSSLSGTATGIFIISGGNTLNGLALQGCGICVLIKRPPAATGTTFSNITISNMVMTNIQNEAIVLSPVIGEAGPGPSSPALVTGNTWDHLLITGNTITGSVSGPVNAIDLGLGGTVGDTLQHTIIANNSINIQTPNGGGIEVGAGGGIASRNDQVLDTLIANNSISGAPPQFAIRIVAAGDSASANLIDGVQIIANQIQFTGQIPSSSSQPIGIEVLTGDGASDDLHPPVLPVQYSENNIARNIGILSNTIQGSFGNAVFGQAACCGNDNNSIGNLSILGNTMTGNVQLQGGGTGGFVSRPSTGNSLSNVLIQANSIRSLTLPGNPNFTLEESIASAGIGVWGASGGVGNSFNGLSIANNDVNTAFIGISIVGGYGLLSQSNSLPTTNNVVSAAQIFCNQVDQAPTLGVTPSSGIKGINVVAGVDVAGGNQVQQLSVYDNLVSGVLDDASLFANLGSGGSGNTISISEISGPVNGPQFSAAGLVSSATFQQSAVAPGSLFSLFGLNLNGATAQFGGISAPVIFASSSQLNLQVPWELQGQSTSQVTVTVNSVTSAPQAILVGTAAPGIFSLGAPQGGQGAIVNLGGIVVDANSPAHAGDYVQIYATGLGAVTNQPATGAAAVASPLSYLISKATVTIGGVQAPVVFAGLAPGFFGLYQVNVQVPQGVASGDAVGVILSIGTSASNAVAISVH